LVKDIKGALQRVEKNLYGTRDKRIAVLGAFDTWPYMDFVSRRLARMGYLAVTSRYLYKYDQRNRKIIRVDNSPDPDEFMVDFLQRMIMKCPRAIIIYSVSGGHFIETDWCYRNHINTLGIALVRKVDETKPSEQCPDLKVSSRIEYSLCRGSKTAFECIGSGACPFKDQGISKNVIEYFLRAGPSNMVLVAVENIDRIPALVRKWTKNFLNP